MQILILFYFNADNFIDCCRCVGRLHVLNLAAKAAADPDYEVTQEDIIDYEATYGKITKGGIVSFVTNVIFISM